MSEAPGPDAPAPDPAAVRRIQFELDLEGLKSVLPAIALAGTLLALVFAPMPPGNEKLASEIAAGLLGFLTGRFTVGQGGPR